MQDWIEEELKTADFGDARLKVRYKIIMDDLSRLPSESIPAACEGWKETIAAYRFFDNPDVTENGVLKPHYDATLRRIQQHPIVLLPQDTTEIEVTRAREKMKGAGPLNKESRLGFFNHVMLALTPERIPLGVIGAKIYARDMGEFLENKKTNKGTKEKKKKQKPIEEKESFRWLEGYRLACEVKKMSPETMVVSISDSEGDIYECLSEGEEAWASKAQWIIRACQDRNLEGNPIKGHTWRKLWAEVSGGEIMGELKIEVRENEPKSNDKRKRKQKRSARIATVTVCAKQVRLKAPHRQTVRLNNVKANAVLLREKDAPADEPPIEWLLLTSLPTGNFQDVLHIIDYYCCRWQIEIYFRVLKSGCKIEGRQFEDERRYRPCMALYMIVAWRVMFVMMMGRDFPDMKCDSVFSEDEWKAVYMIVKKRLPPQQVPSLKEMVKMVSGLGGYLGRKHDGPPGPKAMWIGMQRMFDFAQARQTFKALGLS